MALDLTTVPDGPRFVDELPADRSGVDYLNLRQVNLDMMEECIPGLNNVTSHVRPYSVMCWVYWKAWQNAHRKPVTADEILILREKTESLFLWGHKLHGMGVVPGRRAKVPAPLRGRVSLRFAAWHRSLKNTSLQAAVQYGPSLLQLGFLQKTDEGIYRVTSRGEILAEALDARLSKRTAYRVLDTQSETSAVESDADDLFEAWRYDRASERERSEFRQALYVESAIGQSRSPVARRSTMIWLVLDLLRRARRPLTGVELRDAIAYRRLPRRRSLPFEGPPLQQSKKWQFLLVRQLHRLALETSMGWMEEKLILRQAQTVEELSNLAFKRIASDLGCREGATLANLMSKASRTITTEELLLTAIDEEPQKHDFQSVATRIVDLADDSFDDAFGAAFRALLLIGNCDRWLSGDDHLRAFIGRGGSVRVSVKYWLEIVERMKVLPARRVLEYFFGNLIISQHFAVATNRYDGKTSRLRLALDEAAIESLVAPDPWYPRITPDGLDALLSVMTSCAILEQDDNEAFTIHE